jgi:Bacterial type II and III secretion system protein
MGYIAAPFRLSLWSVALRPARAVSHDDAAIQLNSSQHLSAISFARRHAMKVRRLILSGLVLTALARATCAVAQELADGAVLGPAELIGKLLVVKASFDDEPVPAAPVLLHSDALQMFASTVETLAHDQCAIPAGGATLRPTGIMNPEDEIPYHLTQAFLRLTAAGLNDEAKQIRSLLEEFTTKHSPRLQLARKQAQLDELQTEINRLKLRVEKGITTEQVMIKVKIIEVSDHEVWKRLAGDQDAIAKSETAGGPLIRAINSAEHRDLMEWLKGRQGCNVLSTPSLTTMSGQSGDISIGQVYPVAGVTQTGGPTQLDFGTRISLTPTITDKDALRLAASLEISQIDEHNEVTLKDTFVPGVTRRKMQTHCDIKLGQTVILSFAPNQVPAKVTPFKEVFVFATTEFVSTDRTDRPVEQPFVLPVSGN